MGLEIRRFNTADSIVELTLLIRRAYLRLAEMGFNYTGAYQDEAMTLERMEGNECYVLVENERLIGTITLHRHSRYYAGSNVWFARPEVALCGQFAVEPERQHQGIGSKLMDA